MPFPRPDLRMLVLLSLGLGALGARAQAPEAEPKAAVFDFYIAGLRTGEVTLGAEQAEGEYAAASRIRASGILGAVTGFYFDGRATGRIGEDGTLLPDRFVATSKSPRAERRTEIDWRDGTPSRVTVEPPRGTAPDPAEQTGALDPVSAGFALLRDAPPARLCDASVEVFDGSRLSRLELGPAVERDQRLTCAGVYARIEGEAHSLSDQTEYPFELVFRRNRAGLAELERIETRTRFGLAVIERRG